MFAEGPRPLSVAGNVAPLVCLTGVPYEVGLAHGTRLRDEFHRLLVVWRRALRRSMSSRCANNCVGTSASTSDTLAEDGQGDIAWMNDFAAAFLAATDYVTAIESWTPWLLEEVRGLAAGANVSFEEALTFQLMDEYWFHGKDVMSAAAAAAALAADSDSAPSHMCSSIKKRALPQVAHDDGLSVKKARPEAQETSGGFEHCTAVAFAGQSSSPAVLAQNMDLESFRHGYQIVLRVEDGVRPSQLVFSHAGMLGLLGINRVGVGVVVNNLPQLAHARCGLPVAFMIRGILSQPDFASARSFALRVPHASGQSYSISGPCGGACVVEGCGGGAVLSTSLDAGGFAVHSNHPVVSKLYTDKFAEELVAAAAAGEGAEPASTENSRQRYAAIYEFVSHGVSEVETSAGLVDLAKASLCLGPAGCPHPVCRHPPADGSLGAMSIGACVLISSGGGAETPTMWCAAGPADVHEYVLFEFIEPAAKI